MTYTVAPTCFDRSKIHVQPFDVNGVRCHLLSPLGSNGQLLPCLFYIHGGGFVFRAMIGHYYCEQQYALQAGCRVVDIDYDLAPEHPFPVALNQCVAVYEHIIAHAEEWQIDTSLKAHAETPEFKKYVAEIEACGQMKLEQFEF